MLEVLETRECLAGACGVYEHRSRNGQESKAPSPPGKASLYPEVLQDEPDEAERDFMISHTYISDPLEKLGLFQ